jgi:branched-subunit amino acid ABC-type transport system permease component
MGLLYAQILVNALVLSLTYILIALGLTLVLSVMDILNFAHGAIYVRHIFYTFLMKMNFPISICHPGNSYLRVSGCRAKMRAARLGTAILKFWFLPSG